MKRKHIIFTAAVFGLFVLAQSCDKIKDFGGINNNPNATTAPVTKALLTNVESALGNMVWGNGITISGGLYAQYFSETQYTEASRYVKPVFNMDGFYSGVLYDLQNIINYNSDPATAGAASGNGSNADQIAIARILKAYIFWILTDTWGDLPYFEALKGEGNLAYDAQADIYADLFKELKEAADGFDSGETVQGDILFGGNITKWKKFANSIRILMALRLSKANAALAQSEFNSALSHSAGVIESNSDNAALDFPGGIYNHPLYQYYFITLRFDYALSETVSSFLTGNSDARINAFGSSDVGFPYGLTRDDAVSFSGANPDWSFVLAANKRLAGSAINLISASQIYLARAEAAQRGWTSETVATMYSTGIQRSWEEWGVYDASSFGSYLTQSAVNIATNPLQKIQTQQWLAFYPNGTQGWANWRRTNVPALTPAPGAGMPIPRRVPYGPNDYNFNLSNVETAAAQYSVGGQDDSQDAKVWWDQ